MDKRQAYYAGLKALFEMPGWVILDEDMTDQIETARNQAFYAADMAELGRLRGRAEAFTEIKALPAIIEMNEREQAELDEANADL